MNGISKTFAIYNQAPQYIRDAEGNVYKFIKGYMNTDSDNFLKIVGKVSKLNFAIDFDRFYKKFSPLTATIYEQKNGLLLFEC